METLRLSALKAEDEQNANYLRVMTLARDRQGVHGAGCPR